jgi:3-oxoacyl-[acyl-carrier-protein] synthase-3
MTSIYLNHLDYALGSRLQSVEAAERAGLLISTAEALRSAGFEYHSICAPDESAYDLARAALQSGNIEPRLVDAIIYSTCLPTNGNTEGANRFELSRDVKHLMNFPASKLQADFGMHHAFVVGLNQQACTGMIGAIRVARNMLYTERDLNNVLCITADRFPEGALYEQSYNLVSDGAAACLVSREAAGFRIVDFHHVTNGALAAASDDETAGCYFNYTCNLVQACMRKQGLSVGDVRWFVPQNINLKAWLILSRLLGLGDDKAWIPGVADVGHVISADNIINLKALRSAGELACGDIVVTFMAGYGSNWQCLILESV